MGMIQEQITTIYNLICNNLFSEKEGIDINTRESIMKDINYNYIHNASISFPLSTKCFPKPVKASFIRRRVMEILDVLIDDKSILNRILIAIEEAISNIIEHSYAFKSEPDMFIQFSVFLNRIEIYIDDYGEKGKIFNLSNVGNYESVEELRKTAATTRGGMGVYLIRKIMDKVRYEIAPGEYNRIIMVKYLKPSVTVERIGEK
ncbi:MAG: ATP-binding protein [Spirochaetales bacterium]|nr:ATP-binding protein [Spirochaetales bacterium]